VSLRTALRERGLMKRCLGRLGTVAPIT